MKNYNEQLQEVLDRIDHAYQYLKENSGTCTSDLITDLLGIKCNKKNSVQDIIDSLYFEGVTFEFFKLILSRLNISPILGKETSLNYRPYSFFDNKGKINHEPIYPSKRKMAKFRKHLIADLRMLLLKDAVLNLSAGYSENTYGNHEEKIFLKYSNFQERVLELAKMLELDKESYKGLNSAIEQYSEFIHFKAPKISFPLMAYSLCKTYYDLPVNNKRSDFFLVKGKNLALKSLGRNLYQESHEAETVLNASHKNFKCFSEYLNDYYNSYYPEANGSLSMFLFNDVTKLLDLHMLLIDFQSRDIGSKYDNSKEAKLRINKHFDSLSKLCLIRPLGLKFYLIDTLEDKIFYSDDNLWLTLNNLCTIITVYICCIIEEKKLVEENDALSLDHYLYNNLHDEEPYKIEWITSTLGIYDDNRPEIKAAHFYAYKNLYNTIFQNKKSKYPFENY